MKGEYSATIPNMQFGNIRPTYYFENDMERIEAAEKIEADFKYFHNISAKEEKHFGFTDKELQKCGDDMEREDPKRGKWVNGNYVSTQADNWKKYKDKKKIYPEGSE